MNNLCGKNSWSACLRFLCGISAIFFLTGQARFASDQATNETAVLCLSVDECLQAALKNNRRRLVSRYAVEMAEAQHRQALSGYWPQVVIGGAYQHLDESPNFLFPASAISLDSGAMAIPGLESLPGITIPVPAQDVKLQDPDSFQVSLQLTWLLLDGGMREGHRKQAMGQVEMLKQEVRRTDLEIFDTVTRYYYGAVLAQLMNQLATDTLARLEATLSVTETFYKGGGTVKKTDWLENKVTVEGIRLLAVQIAKNEILAQAALANAMGLSWDKSVRPKDTEIPYSPLTVDLKALVSTAYAFNPDWNKIEAGLRAAEGILKTAKSDHFPKLALFGNVSHWWNDHDSGLATDVNKKSWEVGVGVEIPIFGGFLTQNKVAEAKARLTMIKEQQFLLAEGIGLQLKNLILDLDATRKSYECSGKALDAARENRSLNIRAYQSELVETGSVIRAQLMEAIMSAQHQKVRYDYVALKSKLNLLVGREVLQQLGEK